jgi:hypothetical protein
VNINFVEYVKFHKNGVRKHLYAQFEGGQCNYGTPFDDDGILIDFLDLMKFCKFPWATIGPISEPIKMRGWQTRGDDREEIDSQAASG